jgi:hypothetical protein
MMMMMMMMMMREKVRKWEKSGEEDRVKGQWGGFSIRHPRKTIALSVKVRK